MDRHRTYIFRSRAYILGSGLNALPHPPRGDERDGCVGEEHAAKNGARHDGGVGQEGRIGDEARADTDIEPEGEPREEEAEEGTGDDVRKEVDAKVDARIGHGGGPEEEADGVDAVAEEQRGEQCEAERVGRVARHESVAAAEVGPAGAGVDDGLHHVHKVRVARGPKAGEEGFAEAGGKLVAEGDGQR